MGRIIEVFKKGYFAFCKVLLIFPTDIEPDKFINAFLLFLQLPSLA